MQNDVVIELQHTDMKFAAAHFTIFSKESRENLHGHNFTVKAEITTSYSENDMAFDYGIYKQKLIQLCSALDEYLLLPTKSKFLRVEADGDKVNAYFAKEKLTFLQRDICLLAIENITAEGLAHYFLGKLLEDKAELNKHKVTKISLNVATSPNQSVTAEWENTSG